MSLDETILIGNLELYPNFTRHGGQSTLLFGRDGSRPIALKVYGGLETEDLEDVRITEEIDPHWLKVRNHDYEATSKFGDIDPRRFLSALSSLRTLGINNKPAQILSFGRERESEGNISDRIDFDSLESGRILSLDEVLRGDVEGEKILRVEGLKQLPFTQRLRHYSDMLKSLQIVHRQGVVHNDISPDQFLLTELSNGEYITQLLDFGMHINLEEIESYPEDDFRRSLLTHPTTLAYNSPQMLEGFLEIYEHERNYGRGKSEEEVITEIIENPEMLLERDIVPMARIGYAYLFGFDPVFQKFSEKISEDSTFQRLSRESGRRHSLNLNQDINAQAARLAIEAYEEVDWRDLDIQYPGSKVLEWRHARKTKEKIDALATGEESLDEIVRDLDYRSRTASEKLSEPWSRRKFIARMTAGMAGLGLTGMTGFSIHSNMTSAEHARKELQESVNRLGYYDPDDLGHFIDVLLEERIVPALLRTEPTSTPFFIDEKTGRFTVESNNRFEWLAFPRITKLAAERLELNSLREKYEELIANTPLAPGVGFTAFRIIDPLSNFLYEGSNLEFSQSLRREANQNLQQTIQYIINNNYVNLGQSGYFKASSDDSPSSDSFNAVLRTDSYYLVKHMHLFDEEKYRNHIQLASQALLHDGLTFGKVDAFIENSELLTRNPIPEYKTQVDEKRFLSYATQQVNMIDLLSDVGGELWRDLFRTYRANRQDFRNAPEYLLEEERTSGMNVLMLPSDYWLENNLPFSFLVRTMTKKPDLFGRVETERHISDLIDSLEFKGEEGFLPNSTLSYVIPKRTTLLGDFYALSALDNFENNIRKGVYDA